MATAIEHESVDGQAAETPASVTRIAASSHLMGGGGAFSIPARRPLAARCAGASDPRALAAAVGNRAFSRVAAGGHGTPQVAGPLRRRDVAVEAPRPDRTAAASSALARAVADRATAARRLQRRRTDTATFAFPAGTLLEQAKASPAVQAEFSSGLGPGEPLDAATSARVGSLIEGPVPDVRLHRSETARNTVDLLDSAAITLGNDVALGSAADRAPAGRDWLVAHEVAHAVQQGLSPARHLLASSSREAAAEREADAFADAFTGPGTAPGHLTPADESLAAKVIWKYIQDIPPDKLLIIDVDDGDFVGGCVKQVVPHLGVKLIQKSPHLQLFNIHIGYMTNARGERCVFFYESVSGICETKCFPSQQELEEAWDEILEWLKDLIVAVLKALAIVALAALAVILAWLIVEAIAAALAAFALVLA